LLLLAGPREGENDFVEFPSINDAISYGAQVQGDRRFQLDALEDPSGLPMMAYDELNERCRDALNPPIRRIAAG
jgi:hypothetical protein